MGGVIITVSFFVLVAYLATLRAQSRVNKPMGENQK